MRRVSTVTAVFLKEVDDEFLVKISTHWKTMDKLTYEEMSAVYNGLRERRMFFKVQHTLDDVRLAAATAQLALEMEQREKALADALKTARKRGVADDLLVEAEAALAQVCQRARVRAVRLTPELQRDAIGAG